MECIKFVAVRSGSLLEKLTSYLALPRCKPERRQRSLDRDVRQMGTLLQAPTTV
jgi:hypothetical protein